MSEGTSAGEWDPAIAPQQRDRVLANSSSLFVGTCFVTTKNPVVHLEARVALLCALHIGNQLSVKYMTRMCIAPGASSKVRRSPEAGACGPGGVRLLLGRSSDQISPGICSNFETSEFRICNGRLFS